jgi:hypothetical protein
MNPKAKKTMQVKHEAVWIAPMISAEVAVGFKVSRLFLSFDQ